MAEITPSRSIVLQEDVSYKRSVSEAVFTKFGAQSNFINTFQTDIKEWKLNGSYSVATGIVLYDGLAQFFYNSEIVAISFYNGQAGASGITDFDVEWINTSGGNEGSIFSVNPTIDSTASNIAIGFKNLTTTTEVTGTGITLPTFSKTQFLEGESLIFKLNSAMVSAVNCGLTIFYKPIN